MCFQSQYKAIPAGNLEFITKNQHNLTKINLSAFGIGISLLGSEQGASPLHPDRQGAGAEYFRSGKGGTPFPPGGEALAETGKVIPERHTAPVGDRVGFFADAGHSLRLLPPEVTLGTARC